MPNKPQPPNSHISAAEGAFSVAQWLLDSGADPNPLDRHDRTPLEEAVRNDHVEVVRLMQSHRGKVLEDGQVGLQIAGCGLGSCCVCCAAGTELWEASRLTAASASRVNTPPHNPTPLSTIAAGGTGPVEAQGAGQHAQ